MQLRRALPLSLAVLGLLGTFLVAGRTETFHGYEAVFASNTVAVRAGPPKGEVLSFRVPKRTTDLSRRDIYLAGRGAVLHIPGFLPFTPDGVDDAGEHWEVRMTIPHELARIARGDSPPGSLVHGELYVPAEVGLRSFTGVELREPAGSRQFGVTLQAVYTGPLTSFAQAAQRFLRGFYAAY